MWIYTNTLEEVKDMKSELSSFCRDWDGVRAG